MSDVIENQDESSVEPLDTNPYSSKERKLVTQPYDMSIQTVVQQIDSGDIILEPEYQRKYRWSNVKASRFIESLLLNVPVPTVFLAEEEDVTYSVIDGQQRLSTIRNFISGEGTDSELVLDGLQIKSELNGKRFSDLDKIERGRLIKQYVRCVVILNESDPQIKFDVFERLNSGSVELTEQEIRNCIYRGNFNDLIKRIGNNEKFLEMLNLPEKDSLNMTNVQYVLRFFSYRESLPKYEGSVKEFLNDYMKNNRNLDPGRIAAMEKIFNDTIDVIHGVLGKHAFNRFITDRQSWHGALNRAVYDAEMVAFSRFEFDMQTLDRARLVEELKELMGVSDFVKTIASSTNAPEKVKARIEMIENLISKYRVRKLAD